jgi:lysophospholipase L1-like esterase
MGTETWKTFCAITRARHQYEAMNTPLPRTLRLFSLALAVATLGVPGCQTPSAPPAHLSSDPALRDPERNSAIKPVPRDANWLKRHEGFLAEAKKGGIDVLFLGDSITDFWRSGNPQRGGKQVWDREFAPLHAANFGISADRTQHVLWRLEHGEVDGLSPKVVVLMIGTNNTGLEADRVTPRNTPAQAAEGVAAIVHLLREKLPQTKILLLAVFPREEKPDGKQRQQVGEINERIQKLADGKMVRYLDIGPKFLTPDGTLTRDIMPDLLHPSEKGYEIEAAAIKPTILEMMK